MSDRKAVPGISMVNHEGDLVFDTRVHIRGSDGTVIKDNPYSLHVVRGVQFYQRPPNSDKFYHGDGEPIPLDQVPEECKRSINKPVQSVPAVGKVFGQKKKAGSEPEADSLV